MIDTRTLTIESATPLLNTKFNVHAAGGRVVLSLVEVTKLGAAERTGGAFSTLWLGPKSPVLDQGTYQLSRQDESAIDLFLVPVEDAEKGILYEAIFT